MTGVVSLDAEVPKENSLDEVRECNTTAEEIGLKGVATKRSTARSNKSSRLVNGRRPIRRDGCGAQRVGGGKGIGGCMPASRPHRAVTPDSGEDCAAKYLLRNNARWHVHSHGQSRARGRTAHAGPGAMVSSYKGRAALAKAKSLIPAPDKIEARVRRMELPRASR